MCDSVRCIVHVGSKFPIDTLERPTRRPRARGPLAAQGEGRDSMLWTIAVILIVLWLLGFVTSTTMGGFLHVLLVLAVVVILINVIQGRRAL